MTVVLVHMTGRDLAFSLVELIFLCSEASRACPFGGPTSGAVSPAELSACLLGVTVTSGAKQKRGPHGSAHRQDNRRAVLVSPRPLSTNL